MKKDDASIVILIQSGTCDGDTGSPVIKRISQTAREDYYEQQYLVTTGIDCRLKTKIYVRLSHRQILSWIQQETENVPLVMVVGGVSSDTGFANGAVELIDVNDYQNEKTCKRSISSLPINIFGHIGKYTNGAPRICGGKNENREVVKNCYEYNIVNNEWEKMRPLGGRGKDGPRMNSIALINDKDELWVCNTILFLVSL